MAKNLSHDMPYLISYLVNYECSSSDIIARTILILYPSGEYINSQTGGPEFESLQVVLGLLGIQTWVFCGLGCLRAMLQKKKRWFYNIMWNNVAAVPYATSFFNPCPWLTSEKQKKKCCARHQVLGYAIKWNKIKYLVSNDYAIKWNKDKFIYKYPRSLILLYIQ